MSNTKPATPNNINNRLAKTKQQLNKNINAAGSSSSNPASIIDRLTGLTETFKSAFRSTNNTTSKSNTVKQSNNKNNSTDDNPFNNPWLLATLVIITLGFIAYGVYQYYRTSSLVQAGKSYYGQNLLAYEPLFKINSAEIDTCIKRCQSDSLCSGITFNGTEQTCVGTKQGILRSDDSEISSWIKPVADQSSESKIPGALAGYVSGYKIINSNQISFPANPYQFNWSMYIYINDFNSNHGSWRHIMHKGTDPGNNTLDTPNWEDINADYPEQSIGIWMAPYNNNIRISLSTEGTVQSLLLTEGTSQSLPLEYIDLPHFPNKRMVHLSVNIVDNLIEIYRDGLLYKTKTLVGKPRFNKGNLYIMKSKSIDGQVYDLTYIPNYLGIAKIKKLSQVSSKLKPSG